MSGSPAATDSTTHSSPKRTPLYERHRSHGAKFTEFGGWDMPVQYTGLVDEHHTVRQAAGLFDVSHMGEVVVSGREAFAFLQYVTSNDISRLSAGEAQYSLLLNEKGGVVDDIIVYKFADDEYFLCVNAANTAKDFAWLTAHNKFDCKVENVSDRYGQIALQGPRSREVLQKLLGLSAGEVAIEAFKPFTFRRIDFSLPSTGKVELIVACTGYTGEDGFEIFVPVRGTVDLWDSLLEAGSHIPVKPAGLGARDTLRLEVCYPLHGHELSDDVSALASGVGWVVKFDKGDFIGKAPLVAEKARADGLKLVGLEVIDRGIVRDGSKLYSLQGAEVGWTTSGTKPPTVDKAVALGFVPASLSKLGTELSADVRGKRLAVRVVAKPFFKRPRSGEVFSK